VLPDEPWEQRRLDDLEVVYVWADGLSVKAGREDSKAARLVLIGGLTDGKRVVLAVESGQRERYSACSRHQSCSEIAKNCREAAASHARLYDAIHVRSLECMVSLSTMIG